MKNLILIFILGLSFSAFSQKVSYEIFDVDTLTDAGTVTFTMTKTIDELGYLGFYAVCDSLSGSTVGTVEYYYAPRGSTDWVVYNTTGTVNGVKSYLTNAGIFYGQKFKAVVTGSGTQSTKIKAFIVFKKL